MNFLLIAATEAEIALSREHIASSWKQVDKDIFEKNGNRLHILIGGVGMAATAYHLTKALSKTKFDLALQAGICGAFDRSIQLGEVLHVTSEQFGDMGAEDGENYLDIFDMGLIAGDEQPFNNNRLYSRPPEHLIPKLREVSGLTVNMVTGNEHSVARLAKRYQCQVESMEGAAFHYVCLQENVPFAQVRAVSNYIERRNRAAWKIGEAVTNLNNWLIDLVNSLS